MMLSNVTSQFSVCVAQKVVEKLVEDRIAKALIQIIYRREEICFEIESRPDQTNRLEKDIDFLLVSGNRRIAVEHTRIESFKNQISNVHILKQARIKIEEELKGRVPGDRYYVLTLPTEFLRSLKKHDADRQVSTIVAWATQESMGLGEEQHAKVTLPDADQDVWLECRWSHKDLNGTVLTILLAPRSLDQKRAERYEKIFKDKLLKLHRYEERQCETLLALEDIDIALSNPMIAGKLLQQTSHHHKDVLPRSIYYFSANNDHIYDAWVIKEGGKWLDKIPNRGPFYNLD
jgi:hypothetical protein